MMRETRLIQTDTKSNVAGAQHEQAQYDLKMFLFSAIFFIELLNWAYTPDIAK